MKINFNDFFTLDLLLDIVGYFGNNPSVSKYENY